MTLRKSYASEFTRPTSQRAKELAVDIDIALSTHPEGFTLTPIGFYVLGGPDDVFMPTGYAVGGIIPSLVIRTNPRSYVSNLDKLATWADKYFTLRDALPTEDIYVGGWRDDTPLHQAVYVDAVLLIPDRDKALALASMFNEKAIGHIVNGEYEGTINVE